MGQQPNIELTDAERPRHVLETAPARRWRPTKPGLVTSPEEKPTGGTFGTVGPDPGWAWRVIGEFDLPSDDPEPRPVVAALAMARAAAWGRGAIRADIAVALALCGYWDAAPTEIVERGKRWLAAVPHDRRPGQTAVTEVDTDLLLKKPEQVHYLLTRGHGSDSDTSAN